MSFLGEVAQKTDHIPSRNHAWQHADMPRESRKQHASLSAKANALVGGPFRQEAERLDQSGRAFKGCFKRSAEVVASAAQRPISADDLSYTGDYTFGDRVTDDVFVETKKFIRKARHRRPVSPSKKPELADGELGGTSDGTDARDTTAIGKDGVQVPAGSALARRSGSPVQGPRPPVGELSEPDFSGAFGEDARYRDGPAGDGRPSSRQSVDTAELAAKYEEDEDVPLMPPDPSPQAYLGRYLRHGSPTKTPQHGWEQEEAEDMDESPGGGLPGGKGQSISLAGRRKKRHTKNVHVQAQILTALVTGDQVSYQELDSKFRKKNAAAVDANPWALTANSVTQYGATRGWAQADPPERLFAEPEPEPTGPPIGARNGRTYTP